MQNFDARLKLGDPPHVAGVTLRPGRAETSVAASAIRLVPENFIVRYLKTATDAELAELARLEELDRSHGNKPTPRG